MKQSKQYQKQLKYFGKEFGSIDKYQLVPWQQSYINRIKKDILRKPYEGKKLLDIASGSGYIAIEMAKMGLEVIACDLTPESVINLKSYKKELKLSNLKVLQCPAEKIPLKDQAVDYIVANAILEHISDEQRAINEWKRLLKPKGLMLVTVPLKLRYVWPWFWLLNFVYDKRIGHLRRYDVIDLKYKFAMKVKNHYYTGHMIKMLLTIVGIILPITQYQQWVENHDAVHKNKRYGASNVIVILSNR